MKAVHTPCSVHDPSLASNFKDVIFHFRTWWWGAAQQSNGYVGPMTLKNEHFWARCGDGTSHNNDTKPEQFHSYPVLPTSRSPSGTPTVFSVHAYRTQTCAGSTCKYSMSHHKSRASPQAKFSSACHPSQPEAKFQN